MKPGQRRPLGGDFRARATFDNRSGRGEADRQRHDRRERRRDAEPIAVDEGEKDSREPEGEDQACESEPGRRAAHRHERDHENGKRNRRGRIEAAGRWRPRQSVAGHEIADRGREDFHAGRNAIERRRERVGRASGRNADNDDFAAERLRVESSSEDLNRADAPEASLGPVEAQRHVIAEVHCPRLPRDLDPVGTQDRLGLQGLGRGGERERRNHAVRRFIDHRNVARHAARVGRNVGEPHLRRIADRLDRPENGGGLRRQRQIARFGWRARGIGRVEIADRRDDGRRRLERAGEFCVRVRIPRFEERDIDRDRSGMKTRQGPHESRHHFARGRIAFAIR